MYPLQSSWYMVALSVVFVPLSRHLDSFIPLLLYASWLILLYVYKQVDFPVIGLSFLTLFLAFFYLPVIDPGEGKGLEIDEQVNVEGKIVSKVEQTEKTIQFTLEIGENKNKLHTSYFIQDDEPWEEKMDQIQYGSTCTVKGQRTSPEEATNPYEFDFRYYLLQQGIKEQLTISSMEDIHCTVEKAGLQPIYKIRTALMEKMKLAYSPFTSGWINALLFGNKAFIDEQWIDLFQRWGLSHLLAISGLHVGIISTILYLLFVVTESTTKERATMLIMLFLPFYIFLAGGEPSVWRAACMMIIVMLMQKFSIRIQLLDIISIVMLLLIIMDPFMIYHIGFQFSFAVTFSLILSGHLIKQTNKIWLQAIQISFIAQMAILPLQLYHFSIFQPLSMIVNVLIIPYFTVFVMPLIFIQFIGLIIPFPIFSWIDTLFQFVHEKILYLLMQLDQYSYFPLFIGELSNLYLFLYYSLFILFLVHLEENDWKKACKSGLVFVAFLLFLACRPYMNPYGTVTMLHIGQGDAFVIELPYRKAVYIVDAGASFTFEDMKGSDSVYKNIVRPYLYGRGIQKIDGIFISHEHVDHDGSVPFILQQFDVEEVIVSSYFDMGASSIQEKSSFSLRRVEAGDLYKGKGMDWHIVGPSLDKQDANENSLVIVARFGPLTWMFTGDMYVENELTLMKNYPNLKIDVLKVGHHGSKTSTSEELLQETQPKVALIPVGKNNRYNHPADEVVDRLQSAAIDIYRTDEQGAVQYIFSEEDGFFIPFQKK